MSKLWGEDAVIEPVPGDNWHKMYISLSEGAIPLWGFLNGDDVPAAELIEAIGFDKPTAVYFSISQLTGDKETPRSNEVKKTIEVVKIPVDTELPPPRLEDVIIDIPITDDDPNFDYKVEVSE